MTTADAQWSVLEAKWGLVPDMSGIQALSQQVRMDVDYIRDRSIWLDIKIIIRTAWQTITRSSPNAY